MSLDNLRERLADLDDTIWKKISAIILGVFIVLVGFFFHKRVGPDFWPPDQSTVGPNIIAAIIQGIIVSIIAILLWPPWRKRIHSFVDRKLDVLSAHHEKHHADIRTLMHAVEGLHHRMDGVAEAHANMSRKISENTRAVQAHSQTIAEHTAAVKAMTEKQDA